MIFLPIIGCLDIYYRALPCAYAEAAFSLTKTALNNKFLFVLNLIRNELKR